MSRRCAPLLTIATALILYGCAPDLPDEQSGPLGIRMQTIAAGDFLMGACTTDECAAAEQDLFLFAADDSESPQHPVHVPAFQIGVTEVTLGQFMQFVVAAGRQELLSDEFRARNAWGDDAPVVHVSWNDAQDFIDWLNLAHGEGWRLPTEAEWEYACRAGSQHIHCGGEEVGTLAWHSGNSGGQPRPVGQKQPNGFGLHDMSGNAWEWVQDCWHDDYTGAPSDGSAWTRDCSDIARIEGGRFVKEPNKVFRGGSWYNVDSLLRAGVRYRSPAGDRAGTIGFRLARTPGDAG